MKTPSITRRSAVAMLAAAGCAGVGFLPAQGFAEDRSIDEKTARRLHEDYFSDLVLTEVQETLIGQVLFEELLQRAGGRYKNSEVQLAIQDFARPLFNTSPKTLYSWEIFVVDDFRPNAWALPGGKIAVSKGVLQYAADPDQLSAVIAHEIGHSELGHLERTMTAPEFVSGLAADTGQRLLNELRSKGRDGIADRAVLTIIAGAIFKQIAGGYSQELERDADDRIVKIFRQTRHSLPKGLAFYETLASLVPSGQRGTNCLFNGHEAFEARLSALKEQASQMRETYGARGQKGFEFLKLSFPTRVRFRRLGL